MWSHREKGKPMPNNCQYPEMCLLTKSCIPCDICPNAKEKADDRLALTPCSAISSESVEVVCDLLDDEIQSCDSGETDRERWLQEARDFLWSHHFTQNSQADRPNGSV